MFRSIKTNQLQERELAFHLDGTGTASLVIGSGLGTLVDNGTGTWTITFNKPFARNPVIQVTSLTSAVVGRPSSVDGTAVTILGFAQADGTTPTDGDFYITVKGWDYAQEFAA